MPMRSERLTIEVHPPRKTETLYEFRVDIQGRPLTWGAVAERAKAVASGYGSPFRTTERFGFRAVNYRIQHAEVWDSIFPLYVLTRNHGPLYKKGFDAAVIRFRYPILEAVRQFYVRRAAKFGLSVEVQADTFERTYDIRGRGHVISFGNGKESRLLLGLLRECGVQVRLCTGGAQDRAFDLDVEFSELLQGSPSERVFPGWMTGAAHYYYGSTLTEVHYTQPWHQYYDRSSPQGQAEFNALLHSLGVNLTAYCPLAVLPPNLVQKILSVRYPDLSARQRSVSPRSGSEKQLKLALIHLYHGLDMTAHCAPDLFRATLRRVVESMLARPDDFGYHGSREFSRRETQALLWKVRDHPLVRDVRPQLRPEWDGRWIDHLHRYVHPAVQPEMLAILKEHSTEYDPQPGELRVPTPPADGTETIGRRESGRDST
ncbi:MAG: hypothetical protein AB7J63_05640 [Vicinamibacterales bacterium]